MSDQSDEDFDTINMDEEAELTFDDSDIENVLDFKPGTEFIPDLKPVEDFVQDLKPEKDLIPDLKPEENFIPDLKPEEDFLPDLKPEDDVGQDLKPEKDFNPDKKPDEDCVPDLKPDEDCFPDLKPEEDCISDLKAEEDFIPDVRLEQNKAGHRRSLDFEGELDVCEEALEVQGELENITGRLSECQGQSIGDISDKGEVEGDLDDVKDRLSKYQGQSIDVRLDKGDIIQGYSEKRTGNKVNTVQSSTDKNTNELNKLDIGSAGVHESLLEPVNQCAEKRLRDESSDYLNLEKDLQESVQSSDTNLETIQRADDLTYVEENTEITDYTAGQGHLTTTKLLTQISSPDADVVAEISDPTDPCGDIDGMVESDDGLEFFQNMADGNDSGKNVNSGGRAGVKNSRKKNLAQSSTHVLQPTRACGLSQVIIKTTDNCGTSDKNRTSSRGDKSEQVVVEEEEEKWEGETTGFNTEKRGEESLSVKDSVEGEEVVKVLFSRKKDTSSSQKASSSLFEDLETSKERDQGNQGSQFFPAPLSRERRAATHLSNTAAAVDLTAAGAAKSAQVEEEEEVSLLEKKSVVRTRSGSNKNTPTTRRRRSERQPEEELGWSFGSEPVLVADIVAHRLSQSLTYYNDDDGGTEEFDLTEEEKNIDFIGDDNIFLEEEEKVKKTRCLIKPDKDNYYRTEISGGCNTVLKSREDNIIINDTADESDLRESFAGIGKSQQEGQEGFENFYSVRRPPGLEGHLGGDVIIIAAEEERLCSETRATSTTRATPPLIESLVLGSNPVQGEAGHQGIPDDNREGVVAQLCGGSAAAARDIKEQSPSQRIDPLDLWWCGKGVGKKRNGEELQKALEREKWVSSSSGSGDSQLSRIETSVINEGKEAERSVGETVAREEEGISNSSLSSLLVSPARAEKPTDTNKYQLWKKSRIETSVINEGKEAGRSVSETVAGEEGISSLSFLLVSPPRAEKPTDTNKYQLWKEESSSESYKGRKEQQQELSSCGIGSSNSNTTDSVCFEEENPDWTCREIEGITTHQLLTVVDPETGFVVGSASTGNNTVTTTTQRARQTVSEHITYRSGEQQSYDSYTGPPPSGAVIERSSSTQDSILRVQQHFDDNKTDNKSQYYCTADQRRHQNNNSTTQSSSRGSSSSEVNYLLAGVGGDQDYHNNITMETKGGKQPSGSKSKSIITRTTSNKQTTEGWDVSMAEDEDFEVIDYEIEDVSLPRVRQGGSAGAASSHESLSAEGGGECSTTTDVITTTATSTTRAIKTKPMQRDDEDEDDGFEILTFDPALLSGSSDKSCKKLSTTTPVIDHVRERGGSSSSEVFSSGSKYLETNLDSEYSARSVESFKNVQSRDSNAQSTTRMDEAISNRAISGGVKVGVKKMADCSAATTRGERSIRFKRDTTSDQGKPERPVSVGDEEDLDSDVSEARQLISEIYGEAFKARKPGGDIISIKESTGDDTDISKKSRRYYKANNAGDNLRRKEVESVESVQQSDAAMAESPAGEVHDYKEGGVWLNVSGGKATGSEWPDNNVPPFVVEQYTIGQSYVHSGEPEAGAQMVTLVDNVEGDIRDSSQEPEDIDIISHDVNQDKGSRNLDNIMDKDVRVKSAKLISEQMPMANKTVPSREEFPSKEDNAVMSSEDHSVGSRKKDFYFSGESDKRSETSLGMVDNVFSSLEEVKDDRIVIMSSAEKKEIRQERGRTRERRTVRDVKEAMRKLKGEASSTKERPHSYHGDETEEVRSRSSSRRRYDWNTTHFFPDIHDEDLRPLDKRSDRASQYSLYLEEDWLRDQYYSPQEQTPDNQSGLINKGMMDYVPTDNSSLRTDNNNTGPHLDKENRSPSSYYTTAHTTPPPGEQRGNKKLETMMSSSQEELELVNVREEVVVDETGGSSSDPGDRESPMVWKKSPLHVIKKKRKDRPLSQEVHHHLFTNGDAAAEPPMGAIPIARMGVKMGSPSSRLTEQQSKIVTTTTTSHNNLRGGSNKRPTAPSMGTKVTTPMKEGGGGGGVDIQQKYAKFEELQKRRRALESTSEESLVISSKKKGTGSGGGGDIQDSWRRYNKHRHHPPHSSRNANYKTTTTPVSRKLFQSEEAIHEKSAQEALDRSKESGKEQPRPSLSGFMKQDRQGGLVSQSSSNEENTTNDFLMEMKKKLRSVRKSHEDLRYERKSQEDLRYARKSQEDLRYVRKSQEDLRYEKQHRGEAEGAREIIVDMVTTTGVEKGATMSPYKTPNTSSLPTSSQRTQSSPPSHHHYNQPRSSPGGRFKSQLDHISTETVARSRLTDTQFHQDAISQRSLPEQHRTLSSSFENIYDGLDNSNQYTAAATRNQARLTNGTDSPGMYSSTGKNYDLDRANNPHFRNSSASLLEQRPVSRETNPRGSQGSLDSSSYGGNRSSHGERRSSGDSRTTPTSQMSEGQGDRRLEGGQGGGSRKLDAKALMLEERQKFEAYKREYVRRMSSKDSTSGDETKDSCGEACPAHQPLVTHTVPSDPGVGSDHRPDIPPDEYEYILRKIHHTRQNATVLEKSERAQRVQEANAALAESDKHIPDQSHQPRPADSRWLDSESYLQQQKQKLQQRQKEALQLQREGTEQTEEPEEQPEASHTQQYMEVARKFSFNEDDLGQRGPSDNRESGVSDNRGSYKGRSGHHLYSKSMSAIDSDSVFDQQETHHRYRGRTYNDIKGHHREGRTGQRQPTQGMEYSGSGVDTRQDMTRSATESQQQWYPPAGVRNDSQQNYGTYPKNGLPPEFYHDSVPKGAQQKDRFPRADYNRHSYHEGFDNNRRPGGRHQKALPRHEQQLRQEDYVSKPQESITADFSVPASTKMPRDDYYSYKRKPEEPSYNKDSRRERYQQQPAYHQHHHGDTSGYSHQSYDNNNKRPQLSSGDIKPYHHEKSKKRQHPQGQQQHGSLPDFRHRKDLLKSWSESNIEQQRGLAAYSWDQYDHKVEKYRDPARNYMYHSPDQRLSSGGSANQQQQYPPAQRDVRAPDSKGSYPKYSQGQASDQAYPQHHSPSSQRGAAAQYKRPQHEDQYQRDGYQKLQYYPPPPAAAPQHQQPDHYSYRSGSDGGYWPGDTTSAQQQMRPAPQGGSDPYQNEQWRKQQAPPKPARYQQQEEVAPTPSSHSNPIYDHVHDNHLQTYVQPPTNDQQPQLRAYDTSADLQQDPPPAYQYTKLNNAQQQSQPNYPQRDHLIPLKERSFQVAYSPQGWSPRQGDNNNYTEGDRDRYIREYVPVEATEEGENPTVGPIASVHIDSYFQPVNPNASFSQYSDATPSTVSQMPPPPPQPVHENQRYYTEGQGEGQQVTPSATTDNLYQTGYRDQAPDVYYHYEPTAAGGTEDMQQLEEETFSASRENRKKSKTQTDQNTKPMKTADTLSQPMAEEDRYSELFPPPPPPIEEVVDFPQQDQEVFTQELNDKLRFLKETDPRFRDYEDKVNQYIRDHKSQATNQYEAYIQQTRDSYLAKHQAQLPDRAEYVDVRTIKQRKEGFEELHKKKLLRSRSLPRESASRGRDASPAWHEVSARAGRGREGRPGRDKHLEKEESVFERKAKFTQSFRQSPDRKVSPDKTTEKKPSESEKKKTSQLPSTRHVLRPSRSAENLYQATDDLAKVSVLDIKERLFGPNDHQKPRSAATVNLKPELGKVLERKERKVDVVKDVFSRKEEKVPTYTTSYKSNTGVIDAEHDELLYNIASYGDNREKTRNINIFDDLTDLEITYERLKRENGEDRASGERYSETTGRRPGAEDYDPTEPNVKRLSISNVRKFEELLQRRQDSSPKEEYTKQWVKKEKTDESLDREKTRHQTSIKNKHTGGSMSTEDTASVVTSEDRRFSSRLSLPRKKADDMAYRKTHQVPSSNNSVTLQSLNLVGSYLPQPAGKSSGSPADQVRTKVGSSVPLTRKSRSPEKQQQKVQVDVTVRSSGRDGFKNRDRISMKEARSKFLSGDVQDSGEQRSGGDTEVTVSIRKRAKSLDRNALSKAESSKPRPTLERSNSFGRDADQKNLSKGVASMVMLFTSAKEISQSAPDLTKATSTVFAGHYNMDGDLVSEDPKYKHAVKPKRLPASLQNSNSSSSTPRMIKMRSEMKSKMKGMKTSGDSGFYQEDESDSYSSSDQFHRQPPDGALCDSDEFIDLAKVSDGSLEKEGGKGLSNLRAKFEVHQESRRRKLTAETNTNSNNNNSRRGNTKTPPSPTVKTEMRVELTPPSVRKVNIQAETRIAKENFMNTDQQKPNAVVRPSHIDLHNIKLRKVGTTEEGAKCDQRSKPRDQGSPFASQISQLQYIDDVIASTMITGSPDQVDQSQRGQISDQKKEPEEARPKFEFKREMLRKKDASPDQTSKVSLIKPKAYLHSTSEDNPQKQDHPVARVSKKIMPTEIAHGGLKAPNLDDIGSTFDEELKVARAKLSGKISPSITKVSDKEDEKDSSKDTQAATFEIQFSKPSHAKDSKAVISQISRTSTSSVASQDSPRTINISLSRNSSREGDISQTESDTMSPNVKIARVDSSGGQTQTSEKPQFSWSDSKTKEKITPRPSGESRLKETRESRGFKEERENYSKEVSQVRVVKKKTTIQRNTGQPEPQGFSSHPVSLVPDGGLYKYGVLPMSLNKDLSDGEMTDATDITLDSMVRANLPTTSFDPFSGYKAGKGEADAGSVSSENSQKEYLISEGIERRPPTVTFESRAPPKDSSQSHGDQDDLSAGSASIVSHKHSTKSESSITTETSQSGGTRMVQKEVQQSSSQSHYKREVKKNLRDERRLSLKERVQLFEDQAEPFMRKSKTYENI